MFHPPHVRAGTKAYRHGLSNTNGDTPEHASDDFSVWIPPADLKVALTVDEMRIFPPQMLVPGGVIPYVFSVCGGTALWNLLCSMRIVIDCMTCDPVTRAVQEQ